MGVCYNATTKPEMKRKVGPSDTPQLQKKKKNCCRFKLAKRQNSKFVKSSTVLSLRMPYF